MRILFWLLIAANVILFAVMKSGLLDDGQTMPALHTLHEEKITLLEAAPAVAVLPTIEAQSAAASSVEIVAAADSAPLATRPITVACFEWGDFSGAEAGLVTNALKKLQLGNKLSRREIEHTIGYWVYIAPLKDKASVSQKLAQLKARGVTDYFVVQEAGEWLNAISLGVFKTREAAQNFLEGLRSKDISTARIGERTAKAKTTVFIINNLDAEIGDRLTALQKDFSGSELKRVACH